MGWSRVENGYLIESSERACRVCGRTAFYPNWYCSDSCRKSAKLERKLIKKAIGFTLALGFSLEFEGGQVGKVSIPEYLTDFFPTKCDSFFVFGKFPPKPEPEYICQVQAVFRAYIGAGLYNAVLGAHLIGTDDPTLKQKYLLGAAEQLASSGANGFTCRQCKRTLIKNGLSASDCAGKCYHCCSFDRPF